MRLTLFCAHSDLVHHLLAEVEQWRGMYLHERQRAEEAINALLAQAKGPALTVTPAPPPELSRVERELREMLQNPEFVNAGLVE